MDIIQTNESVREVIEGMGYNINPMHGVPGTFYTKDRHADLRRACAYILDKRKEIGF